jgi:thymidine phosphorylase
MRARKRRSWMAPALRIFYEDDRGPGRRRLGLRRSRMFSQAGRDEVVKAWESGFVAEMDTTALGWAVQRTGAGREKAGEPVDPHAGIVFHARRGAWVRSGQPFATFMQPARMLAEPAAILKQAIRFSRTRRSR